MPENFFITGMPKTGKTTVIRRLVEKLEDSGLKVGGFISPEEKHHGTRTAFHVMDIETGKESILASVDGDGPKVSKYHVDIKSFESVAIPAMQKCDKYDVFVIDEIGRMEMKSRKFSWMLDKVLDSDTPLIVSLSSDYVSKYQALGEVFRLRGNNRGAVLTRVLRKAKEGIKKKPKKGKKKKKAKVKKGKKKAAKKKKAKVKKKAKKKAKKKKPKKKPKKPRKKKKPKKKAPPEKAKKKEEVPEAEEAKKKAIEELKERKEEDEGIVNQIKDLLGF